MPSNLNILITNDDGYSSKGIHELVSMMRQFGRITVVAPRTHQSGMSVAVSLGNRPCAYKYLGEKDGVSWSWLDATPASCVKFALDKIFPDRKCDVVICGINHGSNASVATNYSGTMGAAEEAAINGIPAIGVSLCEFGEDADFSSVTERFPAIFSKLMDNWPKGRGMSYNINFPPSDVPVKGVRVCHQGYGYWVEEFETWDGAVPPEVNERVDGLYIMRGRFLDGSPGGDGFADHHALEDGYISITPQTIDRTDHDEERRLGSMMNEEF
jgi:5'-nucleotidase